MNSPWERGKRRCRRVRGQERSEIVYPVACPQCLQERWLKKVDAEKALAQDSLCYRCTQSQRGKKGFASTVARFGWDFAIQNIRNYRLANPSNLEREIILLLDELGLHYEREVRCDAAPKVYLIDFVIERLPLVIALEIQGAYYHRHRQSEDARKALAIEERGYQLLVITEAQIKSGLARELILNVLNSDEGASV